mmetsp:Transcript_19975/g.55567  ORF Transcript_19975/g.55567 Transcript_19975/m.55567 type:complete len:82 (+) Transcript_19975:1825-2070(+)
MRATSLDLEGLLQILDAPEELTEIPLAESAASRAFVLISIIAVRGIDDTSNPLDDFKKQCWSVSDWSSEYLKQHAFIVSIC